MIVEWVRRVVDAKLGCVMVAIEGSGAKLEYFLKTLLSHSIKKNSQPLVKKSSISSRLVINIFGHSFDLKLKLKVVFLESSLILLSPDACTTSYLSIHRLDQSKV